MPDDVALDLRGPRFDGVAPRAQVAVRPLAVVDRARVAAFQLAVWTQQLLRDLLEALVQLAPENLLDRALGSGDAGRADAAEGAHLVRAHGFDFDVALRQFLADDGIVGGGAAVPLHGARQLDEPIHVALVGDLQAGAERAALVHQRAH